MPFRGQSKTPTCLDKNRSRFAVHHEAVVLQSTSDVAATAIDELRLIASDGSEIRKCSLVVDVTEGVHLWLDPVQHMPTK